MSRITAIKLVKSLSGSEKRQFKLFVKKQSGEKDYIDLFNLIDQEKFTKGTNIEEQFSKLHPRSSIDNAATYLVKVLTDSLIQSRVKENTQSQLLYGLLKVNILNERNLTKEGFKELKKLQQIADDSKDSFIQLILYRCELNYYSTNNFPGLSENYLVKSQMKVRNLLKDQLNLHEHYSLYELLKYRLVHLGQSLSEHDKDRLNDLILSEMGIVNSRAKNSPESKKLHLLFQSQFFTNIGDYRSALKTFYDLNRFFEKNIYRLKNPPFDYFSALDGILDSLRTMAQYEEMDFYIHKLEHLLESDLPEYFRFLVQKTIAIYSLVVYIGARDLDGAISYINGINRDLIMEYNLIDEDKQHELLFYHALSYFKMRNFKKSQKYIGLIVSTKGTNQHSPIFKAAELLSILINYEVKEMEFLDYEIRSYKRSARNKLKPLKTEKLIFKVIKKNPDFNNKLKNEIIWKSIYPMVAIIKKDKYEIQLLKYYNFIDWIKVKLDK